MSRSGKVPEQNSEKYKIFSHKSGKLRDSNKQLREERTFALAERDARIEEVESLRDVVAYHHSRWDKLNSSCVQLVGESGDDVQGRVEFATILKMRRLCKYAWAFSN